ncbi:hypothetical protein Goari_011773 [Gossypium aridum]|uniref:DUF4283 domain-containing protein n=1 Tax=Gossypium aridum TaxID=34290 RepID=A0A7J8WYE2_GOSAI|nr:hypothetical protein [Gossypium aridum]
MFGAIFGLAADVGTIDTFFSSILNLFNSLIFAGNIDSSLEPMISLQSPLERSHDLVLHNYLGSRPIFERLGNNSRCVCSAYIAMSFLLCFPFYEIMKRTLFKVFPVCFQLPMNYTWLSFLLSPTLSSGLRKKVISNVVIELDCNDVIMALNSSSLNLYEFGLVLHGDRVRSGCGNGFSFDYKETFVMEGSFNRDWPSGRRTDNNFERFFLMKGNLTFGKKHGYIVLHNKARSLWKSSQRFYLMDVENGYFLAKFQSPEDFKKVLCQGPWIVYGKYLTLQPWSMDFNIAQPYPRMVMAWIRLPRLPCICTNGESCGK